MKVIGVEAPLAVTLICAPTFLPPLWAVGPCVDPMVKHEVTRLPAASTRPVVSDTGLREGPSVKVAVWLACSLQIVTPTRPGLAGRVANVPGGLTLTEVMLGPSAVWAQAG